MNVVPFTDEMDAALRRDWFDPALVMSALEKRLGVSEHVLRRRARDLKLGARPIITGEWPPEKVEEATRLYREGVPPAELARRWGMTRNAVNGKLDRLGVLRRKGPAIPGQVKPAAVRAPRQPRPKPAPKAAPVAPQLSVAGNGMVFEKVTPDPPRVDVPKRAWNPLPGSTPVGLMDLPSSRCKWPIDLPEQEEQHYCAMPAQGGRYCIAHTLRSAGKGTPSEREAVRTLERTAA